MSKNAMAGAVTLCGVGLCIIGGALMMQSGNPAQAASGLPTATAASIASAMHAQAGPTVVWYGVSSPTLSNGAYLHGVLFRAWSDGTTESRPFYPQVGGGGTYCSAYDPCGQWTIFSLPTEGYRAAADVNADELVNGIDLASVLDNWGDAPRVPFPPSDCPLNLINP